MGKKSAAFVAVDLGASGGKLSLGIFEGRQFRIEEVHRFDNGGVTVWAHGAEGGAVEKNYWDDLALFSHIVEGLRRAGAATTAPILSIGVDTWGSDAALLNAHGESMGPIHCYRDHRLDTIREEHLFPKISPRELFDITGIPSQPWYMLNQLCWLSRYRPEMLDLAATVVPIGSLMQYYLCGSKAAEQSWTVVQQMTRAGEGQYDDRLLSAGGIPRRILPEVVVPGTVVGTIRRELAELTGLGSCKVVAVKMHDTASAFTAAPVDDVKNSLIVSSGTWSLVGKLTDEPLINDAAFEGRLSNEGVRGDVRLLRNVMGTWPVQQLRAEWARADGEEMSWAEIVRMAESAKPRLVRIDVDDEAIYNPPDMGAALCEQLRRTGQAVPTDRGELLRAVYEGLADKIAEVGEILERVTGRRHKAIHVVGGGARNAMLNQFIADAADMAVHAGPFEATSIGSILVQAVACGLFDSIDQARQVVLASIGIELYEPAC
ncbi:MAG: rhamnulokinase [Planctomycetes bacterium]|nr:rhamnulokinase [Planctomycetota bacterium]